MGLELDKNHYEYYEPNSTPKLSLSKFPCKPRDTTTTLQMQTPPLHTSVSIPFQWEEAPGKARASTEAPPSPFPCPPPPLKNKAARCLNLPPRLLSEGDKITIMPSPITVLDGPYVGRSLSLACTLSFRRGPLTAREEGPMPEKKGGARNLGSRRCGSFKEDGKFSRGSFEFLPSSGNAFKCDRNGKMTRVRRRSFFNLSAMNSNLWADIYASLKQAVPWKRRSR